jgi:hypothetical protein
MRGLPWWVVLSVLGVGCFPEVPVDSDPEVAPVPVGPEMVHTAPESAREGEDLVLAVQATDPEGVDEVVGFFRIGGTAAWTRVPLEWVDGVWGVTIPGNILSYPSIEYYFRAQDASDLHTPSLLPVEFEEAPFRVPVAVAGRSIPFEEGFENAGVGGLYGLGWNEYSSGFPGAPWALTNLRSSAGTTAAEHGRGAEGVAPLSDWLVSPPLQLADQSSIEVRWSEYGDFSLSARHSLWISTTSPDPTAPGSGFEKVTDLGAPPEDTWGRSAIVDLSAWSGASTVWLAWHYEGQHADLWAIDDVRVRALRPDVVAGELEVSPPLLEPASNSVVSVVLTNTGTIPAGPLTVSFSSDADTAVFESVAPVAELGAGASATVASTLSLDAAHPDNGWLPITVEVSDGVDVWAFPRRWRVGHPAVADFDMALYAPGLLKLTLGSGDIAAPAATWPVAAEVSAAGEQSFQFDLSEVSAVLPPGPGPDRYWVKVEAGADGRLDAFNIAFDGTTYVGDDLGAFSAGSVRYFALPRPPALAIESESRSPATVAPGSRVTWTAQFRNVGGSTSGPTFARLVSDDPSVTVVSPPLVLGEDWPSMAGVRASFEFEVSSEHRSSRPVTLRFELADAVESVSVPLSVNVPWPVLQVVSVAIDDEDGGDDDGMLESGEEVGLTVSLANVGGRDTFAGVTCDLETVSGPVEVLTGRDSFGVIGVAVRKAANDFVLRAGSGTVGDMLLLELSCSDGTTSYQAPVELTLGEAPWLSMSTLGDAPDDAVSDYGFDLLGGRYRVMGDTLQLQLDAAEAFDPDAVFIEAWMESLGADYWNYQLILQSGVPKLRGYRGSFTTLAVPTYAEVDADTLQVGLDLSAMGLSLDELSLGFAAGFCGGDDYYCDQFPDGWGNPYRTGLISSAFVDLRW